MNRDDKISVILIGFIVITLLCISGCSSSKRAVSSRRSYMMPKTEEIYKNHGFYKPYTDHSKQHQKNVKRIKKSHRR